ncbi:uncharacterized protein BO97DRAFT_175498 [Aspergillus homomorphus CBS 101889]|uniref:Uncharacterized protein n=1 Tax=Aspergillus homomorphus (strain CBS 101889) TaxID=1450537 RepID=A0A395I7M7_ASPHC|nr:hypothetical protein BO97DRAFT_175498 [Aspergillus homomorphus CBS 101889]RAL15809.1 hypothetical protein BO97DRAFT_175498 [Aspergillus homomorphus CBS 101889]
MMLDHSTHKESRGFGWISAMCNGEAPFRGPCHDHHRASSPSAIIGIVQAETDELILLSPWSQGQDQQEGLRVGQSQGRDDINHWTRPSSPKRKLFAEVVYLAATFTMGTFWTVEVVQVQVDCPSILLLGSPFAWRWLNRVGVAWEVQYSKSMWRRYTMSNLHPSAWPTHALPPLTQS